MSYYARIALDRFEREVLDDYRGWLRNARGKEDVDSDHIADVDNLVDYAQQLVRELRAAREQLVELGYDIEWGEGE